MRLLASVLLGTALIATAVPAAARDDKRAARGEAQLAKIVDGRVAGKPVHCLDLNRIQSTEIIEGTAIVYRVYGNQLYVNRPLNGEQTLHADDIPVTKVWNGQVCRLDTINLIDRESRFPSGFVGLGDFVPYTKVPAKR